MSNVSRRLVGVVGVILLVATGKLAFDFVTYLNRGVPVSAVLGKAGSGLAPGSDVKLRGVPVGRVTTLEFRDGRAVAGLEIDEEPRIPRDVRVVVAAKTLLGPKEIQFLASGALEGPYLEEGDVLRVDDADEPTELQAVVHELERVFEDIPPGDLGVLVDALGSFSTEDAELIARNIEQGDTLAEFGARTAEDQLERLRALADIAEALAPRADDFNRLNESLPDWVSLLPDRQDDVRAALDELGEFATGLAELLEVERSTISALLETSDVIGAVIEPRVGEIGRFIQGIYRYARAFGEHGGSLNDGTEHAWFRAHIGNEGEMARFCAQLPPEFQEILPGCVAEQEER